MSIQDRLIKIQHQISALRVLWDTLDEQLREHQNSVLQVLHEKLQKAISKLSSLIRVREEITAPGKPNARVEVKRLKYAMYAKASLDGIIDDLGKWQAMFDPSWFILARIAGSVIDHQLTTEKAAESKAVSTVMQMRQAHSVHGKGSASSSSVFLRADYAIRKPEPIRYSSASAGFNSDQRVIIDHIPVGEQTDLNAATTDVRDLARVLSKVDPGLFGLLCCQGVIKVRDHGTEMTTGFDFIYPIPPGLGQTDPLSLRSLLFDRSINYPLNERLHLAVSLARSIVFLHSSRIVHKSISPENIIVLQSSSDSLGPPFLVGFERFRFDNGRTYMSGDCRWEKNFYRHPRRQGLHPEELYSMQHDIYSLGICLLEIGLWSSFVTYSGDQQSITPGPELPISHLIGIEDHRMAAAKIKAILAEVAQSRLPGLMGKIYTDIVVTCLTCLDKDNIGFGDETEFQDEDGILVGVRYIEKVILVECWENQQYVLRNYVTNHLHPNRYCSRLRGLSSEICTSMSTLATEASAFLAKLLRESLCPFFWISTD